ncbi:hypothetical protein Q3G72_015324 [Acer saccharum]|nr:hypothetical protein Q3G72_015324 [Acer saccharum]
MDDEERLFLAVKLWLVLVPVIITVFSNSKLVAACDEVFEADALGKYQKQNFVLSVETDKEAPGIIYGSEKAEYQNRAVFGSRESRASTFYAMEEEEEEEEEFLKYEALDQKKRKALSSTLLNLLRLT